MDLQLVSASSLGASFDTASLLPGNTIHSLLVFPNVDLTGYDLLLFETVNNEPQAISSTTGIDSTSTTSNNPEERIVLTAAQMNEVIALTYNDCDASPSASPSWSKIGMEFDAINPVDGANNHYYCGYTTYVPNSGVIPVQPAWHCVEKLSNSSSVPPTPMPTVTVNAQRVVTLSNFPAGTSAVDYEYQVR
jgi:hypothetical protein